MAEDTVGLDLEAEIDRLYAGPLNAFVEGRNELSRRLRATGQRDVAQEVKSFTKPSITAWATNQVVHHEPEEFERLLAATRGMQQAHASDPSALKQHGDERRDALARLTEVAGERLRDAGSPASRAQVRTVTGNLEALSLTAGEPEGPRPGRLSRDLQVPGFGAFTGFPAAGPARPKPARTSAPDRKTASGKKAGKPSSKKGDGRADLIRKRRKELEKALASAEAEVARASRAVMKASARTAGLEERFEALQKEARQAQREAERAARAADRATDREAEAEQKLTEARQTEREAVDARRSAQAASDAASRALESLNDD